MKLPWKKSKETSLTKRAQILQDIEILKAHKVKIQLEIAQKVQEYREEFD